MSLTELDQFHLVLRELNSLATRDVKHEQLPSLSVADTNRLHLSIQGNREVLPFEPHHEPSHDVLRAREHATALLHLLNKKMDEAAAARVSTASAPDVNELKSRVNQVETSIRALRDTPPSLSALDNVQKAIDHSFEMRTRGQLMEQQVAEEVRRMKGSVDTLGTDRGDRVDRGSHSASSSGSGAGAGASAVSVVNLNGAMRSRTDSDSESDHDQDSDPESDPDSDSEGFSRHARDRSR